MTLVLPQLSLQVDTFQSDVAAITADLRKPLGGSQGGQAAAGLVARGGFESSTAPAGAVSRPASRVKSGAVVRTAVKPSASWRLGDVAPLAVGEPLDDGACSQQEALCRTTPRCCCLCSLTRVH